MLEIEDKLKKADMGYEVGDTLKLEAEYEKLTSKLQTLVSKKKEFEKPNFNGVKDSIDNIGNSINKTIKRVGKWALAIFGIRSAYLAVRKSASILSNENKEIKNDLANISSALANALLPVVKTLISWVKSLLSWANSLWKSLFGKDLFKSGADNLENANNSAKKLKKTMLGFDEINKLGEEDTSGEGYNSSQFNQEIGGMDQEPKFLTWIKDNGPEIIATIAGIASAISAIKIGDLLKNMNLIPGSWGIIKSLGIGIAIAGIIMFVKDLSDYLKNLDSSLENNGTSMKDFGKIVKDVGLILLGVGMIIGNAPLAIAGAIALILGTILKNWDTIKGWLNKAWNWIDSKLQWLENKFGIFGLMMTEPIRMAIKTISDLFGGLFRGVKGIFDGILLIFKGDFKGGLISIGKGILNLLITIINTFINSVNLMITPVRALIVGAGKLLGKKWTMDNIKIPTIKYLATGGIIDVPKRGVALSSNVVGGEAGAEGVLPLTNADTMSKLGKEIGKWITINANITNEIDGRVLNKRLQQINEQNTFSRNGG